MFWKKDVKQELLIFRIVFCIKEKDTNSTDVEK